MGQVFDDYKINNAKEIEKIPEKIEFLDKSTVVFTENIHYNKYNYEKNNEYQLDYIEITRFYLIEVMKKLLMSIAQNKPQENSGFFMEFKGNYPGVIMPFNKNQELVTISLREKFFNLTIEENEMSVILSFNNQLQKVVIPYKAITNFFDPHWNFKIDLSFIDFIDEKILEQNEDKITYMEF